MQYVFLFPGQGSQKVGMGDYLKEIPLCNEIFQKADQSLGFSITELMEKGPEEELTKTYHAQPAILTVAVAMGRYLMENGIMPSMMAGHSLGEYACLVLSDAMRFEDAVKAVHHRGKYMQEAVALGVGTMSAVLGLDDNIIEQVCEEVTNDGLLVEPANYNCPGQLVISGTVEGVRRASEFLKEKGAKRCIELPVSAPFHCSLLEPASQRMEKLLETIEINDPHIPYIANVDVDTITQKNQIRDRLVSQIDHPVLWTQTLTKLAFDFPKATFVEVGAAKVVSGHLKKVYPDAKIVTTDSIAAVASLIQS